MCVCMHVRRTLYYNITCTCVYTPCTHVRRTYVGIVRRTMYDIVRVITLQVYMNIIKERREAHLIKNIRYDKVVITTWRFPVDNQAPSCLDEFT